MGNGFMSRPSSADSVSWGRVEAREDKDEDLFQPIRNYSGEIVGWKERCVPLFIFMGDSAEKYKADRNWQPPIKSILTPVKSKKRLLLIRIWN